MPPYSQRHFLLLISEIKQVAQKVTCDSDFSAEENLKKTVAIRKEVLRQISTLDWAHLKRLTAALSLLDDIVRDQLNIERLERLHMESGNDCKKSIL